MSKPRCEDDAIGEDAFLDTIANLVGILIILVVLVGSRSYAAAKVTIEQELKKKVDQLESRSLKSQQLDQDLQKQAEELHNYDMEVMYRDSERMAIMDRVTVAERMVEEELQNIDEAARETIEVEQEMSELAKQLANLLGQQGEIQSRRANDDGTATFTNSNGQDRIWERVACDDASGKRCRYSMGQANRCA